MPNGRGVAADEERAREIAFLLNLSHREAAPGEDIWVADKEAVKMIASALSSVRAEEREECAKAVQVRAQSLRAALTGDATDLQARLHATIHNIEQCAAAIRARGQETGES